jgi:hypothetical protein
LIHSTTQNTKLFLSLKFTNLNSVYIYRFSYEYYMFLPPLTNQLIILLRYRGFSKKFVGI